MTMFGPVWKTAKSEKKNEAIAMIHGINDLKKLKEIVHSAFFPEVRLAALCRIKDPEVLKEIIYTDTTEYEIRREAVRMISDPNILAEIAIHRQAYPADGEAIAMLNDQTLLKLIALSEQGGEQDKAVYKIISQQDLAEIAVKAKKGSARKIAVQNITDPDILLMILSDAEEVYTRSEAFDRLNNLEHTGIFGKLSEEQHQKKINVIIRERDQNVRIDLSLFTKADDLKRIYREASRNDLRAKALEMLVMDNSYPVGNLLKDWKTSDSNRKTIHNTFSNPWQNAQNNIEARLEIEENKNPALLLNFISDPEVGCDFAMSCLKSLFGESFRDHARIDELQEKAFAAFLRNIPEYATQDGNTDFSGYLLKLTGSIPAEFHERYGLSVFAEEYGDR